MKQMVFWWLLFAAVPAWAASPDSAGVGMSSSESSPTAAQRIEIGQEWMKQGNYTGAALQFERAVEKEPSNLSAHLKLSAAYTKAGLIYPLYFTKAESTLARVADLVGKDNVDYRKGVAALELARWNVDSAVSILQKLTDEHPESCDNWLLLADAQRLKGLQVEETEGMEAGVADLDLAEKSSRKAMALCPDRIEPVQMLATIMDTRKNYAEVVDLWAIFLKERPDDVAVLRGYAIATFNARDWEKAAQALGDLLKKDPRFEERMLYIAVLRKLNRPEVEEQERIARKEQPIVAGPVQLTAQDVLKEKLGIQKDVEQGVALIEKNQCDAAVTLWKGTRTRIEPYLQDAEFKSAAEDLLVWLDRRILYAQGACK